MDGKREAFLGRLCGLAVETAAQVPEELLNTTLEVKLVVIGTEFAGLLQDKINEVMKAIEAKYASQKG